MTIETKDPVHHRRPKAGRSSGAAPPEPTDTVKTPPPPRMRGRRNPKWVALGVVALCLGALLSYVIYARVAQETAVVALVHTVSRGNTIQATDLATVKIGSVSGVPMVPAAERDALVGRQAVYDLIEGSLLSPGAVADVVIPRPGHAVVGVRLVSGRAPAGLIPPGSPLRLVALPPAGADPNFTDANSGRIIVTTIVSQVDGADGASVILNVDVAANLAPAVALLASQERLAVVRDADK